MSVPPGTEMFQFPGFASYTYVFSARYLLLGGFPHSEISGSTIARISPKLIAACHVLHRLLAPRHPPSALNSLSPTTHAPTRRTISPASKYPCSRHSSMLSITQPMRLNPARRIQPRYFYTPIPIHLSKQLARTRTAPITGASSSRQTGFSMHRKPSPPGRSKPSTSKDALTHANFGDYRIRTGEGQRPSPPASKTRIDHPLWRLSDSNR